MAFLSVDIVHIGERPHYSVTSRECKQDKTSVVMEVDLKASLDSTVRVSWSQLL